MGYRIGRWLHRIGLVLLYALFFLTLATILTQEYPPPGDFNTRISRAVGNHLFDFGEWTLEAWAEKGAQIAVPIDLYLTDDQRRQFVLDFMNLMREYWTLEGRVQQVYSDPANSDPAAASAELRAQRDAIRADLERRRPTAEAIIQQQISAVLIDEGFGIGGEIFPPVALRITPLPNVLIVSPRDQIKRIAGEALQAGLQVDQAEAIETRVLTATDDSSLVVPIGGLADYPAMILESTQLLWLLQTSSHEWSHHWLFLRPLGYSYLADTPDVRTINETVASIFGDEVGLEVMRRFYPDELKRTFPDLVEPKSLTIPTPEPETSRPSPTPGQFSFNRALRDTRIKVDGLLAEARAFEQLDQTDQAEAKIRQAEDYMEQQRQYINTQGYHIRKINQAYFAFYGAYADQPGASGGDPIGPNVIALRVYSSSVRDFMDRASHILSLDQLRQAVEALKPKS
jgi:hypothetical protein